MIAGSARCGCAPFLRRLLSLLAVITVALGVSGCAESSRAVGVAGDTVAHDSIDDGDLMVGVVGSETTTALDSRVVDQLDDHDMRTAYSNASGTSTPHASRLSAVRDYTDRDVSVVVIMGMDFGRDRSGWTSTLEYARSSGVPVVAVDASSMPTDGSLVAVGAVVRSTATSTLAQAVDDVANNRSAGGRMAVLVEE